MRKERESWTFSTGSTTPRNRSLRVLTTTYLPSPPTVSKLVLLARRYKALEAEIVSLGGQLGAAASPRLVEAFGRSFPQPCGQADRNSCKERTVSFAPLWIQLWTTSAGLGRTLGTHVPLSLLAPVFSDGRSPGLRCDSPSANMVTPRTCADKRPASPTTQMGTWSHLRVGKPHFGPSRAGRARPAPRLALRASGSRQASRRLLGLAHAVSASWARSEACGRDRDLNRAGLCVRKPCEGKNQSFF